MTTALLFARDPGGANTIIPLIKPLTKKGYKVLVFGKDKALERYQIFGLKGEEIGLENQEGIKKLIVEAQPDFVITGTSFNPEIEIEFWKASRELKIPSFAIIDQWMNYKLRFINQKGETTFPDKIFVMDEIAKIEAIKEGLDGDKIVVTGQPYFEIVLEEAKKSFSKTDFLKRLNISPEDFIVTFVSEPISSAYKNHGGDKPGYNEKEILNYLADSLDKIAKRNIKITLVVRPHPKDDISSLKRLTENLGEKKINVVFDKDLPSAQVIKGSDLICGMSSMFLLESVIFKKPILSIQIGLKTRDPFVLSRTGQIKSVLKTRDLETQLYEIIVKKKLPIYTFEVIQNPAKRILDYIEKHYV